MVVMGGILVVVIMVLGDADGVISGTDHRHDDCDGMSDGDGCSVRGIVGGRRRLW